jgi:hypothetical protein
MKLGRLLIFAGEETGLPPGRRRKRFVKLVHNFLRFSEVNGLTTHAILKKRQKAVIDVNVFSSDFTHEGYKFFRRAYNKWSKAIEEGALDPDETDFLAAILANPRAKAPVLSERRPGKSRVKTTGRQATSVRGKRNKSKLANTFDDEYELAGPHVHDKADWHLEGEFPEDLREDQAYVHTGLFAAWLSDRGLITGEYEDEANQIKRRKMTGPKAYKNWGGVLASDMLSDEGNAFTREYYDTMFCPDYEELLSRKLPSFYHVKDTWENYEILKQRIDKRFQSWKTSQAKRKFRL